MKNYSLALIAISAFLLLGNISQAKYYDPRTGRFLSRDPMGVVPPYAGVNAASALDQGRFISRDPIGHNDGPDRKLQLDIEINPATETNLYDFARSCPMGYLDPQGLHLVPVSLPYQDIKSPDHISYKPYLDDSVSNIFINWDSTVARECLCRNSLTYTSIFRTKADVDRISGQPGNIILNKNYTSLHLAGWAVDISIRGISPIEKECMDSMARLYGMRVGENFSDPPHYDIEVPGGAGDGNKNRIPYINQAQQDWNARK